MPVAPEGQVKASATFLFVLNLFWLQRMVYAQGFLLVFPVWKEMFFNALYGLLM
jgi:hypothetical protein